MSELNRRELLQLIGIGAASIGVFANAGVSLAQDGTTVTIGWPSDVPSWDPNERTVPDAQPIYKLVFDQPIDQAPDFSFVPNLVTAWEQSADGRTLTLDFRDDVVFHDGTKFTSEDFAYTFHGRAKAGHKIDIANLWGKVTGIDTPTPTRAVMTFSEPAPTAVPWLAFLASFVVPKALIEAEGVDAFRAAPVGTGPYKLVEYQLNSRIVLERNDAYFGEKPAAQRVIFQIIGDPSARTAALESGQVDLALNIPIREVERLEASPDFTASVNPISRIIMLYVRGDGATEDRNVRLAMHHAIDKEALSKAFYLGAAVPLAVLATPGTPGYVEDFTFAYDPEKAKALLAESGYSEAAPAKIKLGTHNGQFPGDYDIARALVQMWSKVGIEGEIEVIEYAKFFELNRTGQLPDTMLYSWDNSTGDPEIYIGYLMNPQLPFSAWRQKAISEEIPALFAEADTEKRIAAYRDIEVRATNEGAVVPLLQSVLTIGHKDALKIVNYGNGWVLANRMSWG